MDQKFELHFASDRGSLARKSAFFCENTSNFKRFLSLKCFDIKSLQPESFFYLQIDSQFVVEAPELLHSVEMKVGVGISGAVNHVLSEAPGSINHHKTPSEKVQEII